MIASVLPGLRDARTPLAVGLLWLTVLWVWFGWLIPTADEANGLISQLYRLTGVLGSAILLAMLAFAGYIVGLLASSLHLDWTWVRRALPPSLQPLSWQTQETLRARYLLAIDRAAEAGVTTSEIDQLVRDRDLAGRTRDRSVASDIALTALRLQGTHKDIYDDYDRFKSEAEFRRSVALPLAVLLVAATYGLQVDLGAWIVLAYAVALLVFFALHGLSWRKSREGNELVIQSILSGQVMSPTIEAIETAIVAKRERASGGRRATDGVVKRRQSGPTASN